MKAASSNDCSTRSLRHIAVQGRSEGGKSSLIRVATLVSQRMGPSSTKLSGSSKITQCGSFGSDDQYPTSAGLHSRVLTRADVEGKMALKTDGVGTLCLEHCLPDLPPHPHAQAASNLKRCRGPNSQLKTPFEPSQGSVLDNRELELLVSFSQTTKCSNCPPGESCITRLRGCYQGHDALDNCIKAEHLLAKPRGAHGAHDILRRCGQAQLVFDHSVYQSRPYKTRNGSILTEKSVELK